MSDAVYRLLAHDTVIDTNTFSLVASNVLGTCVTDFVLSCHILFVEAQRSCKDFMSLNIITDLNTTQQFFILSVFHTSSNWMFLL